jgi:hypothetical protein
MMKRAVDSFLFNGAFALYLVYRSYRWSSGASTIALIDCYLADVLAMPVILAWSADLLSWLYRKRIWLSFVMIIVGAMYTGFVMEYLAPRYLNEQAVADGYDLLAYACGALAYHYFGQPRGSLPRIPINQRQE